MEKYRISKSLDIISPIEYNEELCPDRFRKDHHVITSTHLKKGFLINNSVRYFLEKFNSFKTLDEVVVEIAEELGTDKANLFDQCENIFNILKKKSFLEGQGKTKYLNSRLPLFKAGDNLGIYTILSLISDKKYVDLYRVCKHGGVHQFVIKLLNSKKTGSLKQYKKELAQFKHEYQLLSQGLFVDSLCKAYQFDFVKNRYAYIVMESIDGKGIPKFLRHQNLFTEKQANVLVFHILEGFAKLHAAKIIHGDIHPSNIMIKNDHEVKIIDLGLALIDEHSPQETVKKGGVMYYMPPERINTTSLNKFSSYPDYHSDVYQLGLVIFYIFFREEPFQGFIWEDLAQNIKNKDLIFPKKTAWQNPLHPELARIISKCTAKNPADRYKDARELLIHFQNTRIVKLGKEKKYHA